MILNTNEQIPLYLQLEELIRQAILAEDLKIGDAIPSIRQLSVEHGLNPQTILKATHRLHGEGVLEKRRGIGLYVTAEAPDIIRQQAVDQFRNRSVPEFALRGHLLGLSIKELCALLKEEFERKDHNGTAD